MMSVYKFHVAKAAHKPFLGIPPYRLLSHSAMQRGCPGQIVYNHAMQTEKCLPAGLVPSTQSACEGGHNYVPVLDYFVHFPAGLPKYLLCFVLLQTIARDIPVSNPRLRSRNLVHDPIVYIQALEYLV